MNATDHDFDCSKARTRPHDWAIWLAAVREAGFEGSVLALWEMVAAALRAPGSGQSARTIAADPVVSMQFCQAIRATFGTSVADSVVLAALRAMPPASSVEAMAPAAL